jgi:tRNA dimethylallyltransferase
MDIGTGKDLNDYIVNGQKITYHLIDILEAGEKYNVFRFKKDFYHAYNIIKGKNKIPVLCGGSGMYIEAILRNYILIEVPENPDLRKKLSNYSLDELKKILEQYKTLHNKTDVDTKKRAIRAIEIAEYYKTNKITTDIYPTLKSLTIGISVPREIQREKITKRLKDRLESGMIDEVKSLLDKGISAEDLIYYGLEYKYITEYLIGKYSYDEMFRLLETAIHQFAKRQMTYFRGMERRGIPIIWIDGTMEIKNIVSAIIENFNNC